MENAAKALTIAGGILISLLILGIIIFGYNNLSNLSKQQEDKKEIEQLAAFNKEYESYNRKLLRGVDVISLMYKAIDNNEKYKDNLDYYGIEITFKMKNPISYKKEDMKENGKTKTKVIEITGTFNTQKEYSKDDFFIIKNNSDAFTDFKRRIFNCINITYNKKSGRVKSMHFEEQLMTDEEYKYGI